MAEVVALVTSRRGQVVLADLAVVVAAALAAAAQVVAGNKKRLIANKQVA